MHRQSQLDSSSTNRQTRIGWVEIARLEALVRFEQGGGPFPNPSKLTASLYFRPCVVDRHGMEVFEAYIRVIEIGEESGRAQPIVSAIGAER